MKNKIIAVLDENIELEKYTTLYNEFNRTYSGGDTQKYVLFLDILSDTVRSMIKDGWTHDRSLIFCLKRVKVFLKNCLKEDRTVDWKKVKKTDEEITKKLLRILDPKITSVDDVKLLIKKIIEYIK